MEKLVLCWKSALAYWQKLLKTQDLLLHSNQGLERGLLRAFRTVMGFRLLLWLVWGLMLRLMDMRRQLEPLAFDPQTLVSTALLDGLLLVVLLWPALRPKIGQRQFGWLLAISSAVLFYGHASVLAFRGIEGALLATIFLHLIQFYSL